MSKGSKYSQQFKEDAVRYKEDHPELAARQAAALIMERDAFFSLKSTS